MTQVYLTMFTFGHIMRSQGSLGKTEGIRKKGRSNMRWLDPTKEAISMHLQKLNRTVEDRTLWTPLIHKVARSQRWLNGWHKHNTKTMIFPCHYIRIPRITLFSLFYFFLRAFAHAIPAPWNALPIPLHLILWLNFTSSGKLSDTPNESRFPGSMLSWHIVFTCHDTYSVYIIINTYL